MAFPTGGSSSCKLLFVVALIRELHSRGHRTLVFSQSKVMLDILGGELRGMQLRFLRIDGSLSAEQREAHPFCPQSCLIPHSHRLCGLEIEPCL